MPENLSDQQLDDAAKTLAGLTGAELKKILNSPIVKESSATHRILTAMAAAERNFLKTEEMHELSSTNSGISVKTRVSVLQRLVTSGFVERGYILTALGEQALTLATPLRKLHTRWKTK